jgi:hypothetical protein
MRRIKENNWKIRKSVYATFTDAGFEHLLYRVVLGFSVFMLSSFEEQLHWVD